MIYAIALASVTVLAAGARIGRVNTRLLDHPGGERFWSLEAAVLAGSLMGLGLGGLVAVLVIACL